MLLKAGTSIKQALLCNVLSACLQLFGVIIGLAVGIAQKSHTTKWLFSFAGGIFLYIGLVDMVRIALYNYSCYTEVTITVSYSCILSPDNSVLVLWPS